MVILVLRYMYSLLFCILLHMHVKMTIVYDYCPSLSEVIIITFFHKLSFKYFGFSINLSSVPLYMD